MNTGMNSNSLPFSSGTGFQRMFPLGKLNKSFLDKVFSCFLLDYSH